MRRSSLATTALLLAPVCVLLVEGFERRWMDDDGFINLRVVRNLLEGAGPVFNVGERVEAVTSPLWVGFLALFGTMGVRLEYAAVYGGIAFAALAVLLAQDGAACLQTRGPTLAKRWKAAPVPLGMAVFVALPPVWDYASSGLETGIGLAWLAASFRVTTRSASSYVGASARSDVSWADAMLVGLGPLIRPEFALYSSTFLALLIWAAADADRRSVVGSAIRILAPGLAIPLAYEVFRMGYFAAIAPNTAAAKEAFLPNVSQGICYFNNFFGTYWMGWPLAATAVFFVAGLHAHWQSRRSAALRAMLAPPLVAGVHIAYVVRMGGDYMHGRMLLPAAFALLLPAAAVPLRAPLTLRSRAALAFAGLILCAWIPLCGFRLRVAEDNVCGIGDERGWYARKANVDNPVLLDSYKQHPFYKEGRESLERVLAACPGLSPPKGIESGSGCRLLHLADKEQKEIAIPEPNLPLATDVDPRVVAVLSAGAVGMFGYLMPSSVHVIDRHGLADPIVARREIRTRGRPGHEKTLPAWWLVGRFAESNPLEDASVAAARHALHCGLVRALEHAVTGPLTPGAFFDNVVHAWDYGALRLPPDAFEAETRFCGTPAPAHFSVGGSGGAPFQWLCPAGLTLSGLRGTYSSKDRAIASVRPVCGDDAQGKRAGPLFGSESKDPFEVACPDASVAAGTFGYSDNLVRAVGLSCLQVGGAVRTLTGGNEGGQPFSLTCPEGTAMSGVEGRAGGLLDRLGIVCSSSP